MINFIIKLEDMLKACGFGDRWQIDYDTDNKDYILHLDDDIIRMTKIDQGSKKCKAWWKH